MFDVPVDSWYAWVGLSLASVAVFAAAGSLPASPPPDAASVADTIDRVAGDDRPSTAEHPLDAAEINLTPRGVHLRNDAGVAHARFAFGPVTPVREGSDLQAVLHGAPPERVFDSRRELEQAVVDARSADRNWEPVDRTLVVRRLSWRGYDVTLVGA